MDNTANFIKNNPEKANSNQLKWRAYQEKFNIPNFASEGEFVVWTRMHLGTIPDEVKSGFMVSRYRDAMAAKAAKQEAASQIETEPEEPTPPAEEAVLSSLDTSAAFSLFALPGMLNERAEIIEHDKRFHNIMEEKKREWRKNNPGKDYLSREGLDYIYGSLEHPDAPTLHSEAKEEYKKRHPNQYEHFEKQAKKIYKDPDHDPSVLATKARIADHLEDEKKLAKKEKRKINETELKGKIESLHWDKFAEWSPEKAKAYREHDSKIEEAYAKKAAKTDEKMLAEAGIDTAKPAEHTPPPTEPPTQHSEPTPQKHEAAAPVAHEHPPHEEQPRGTVHEHPRPTPVSHGAPPHHETPTRNGLMDHANRVGSRLNSKKQQMGNTMNKALSPFKSAMNIFKSPQLWVFGGLVAITVILISSGAEMITGGSGGGDSNQTSTPGGTTLPPITSGGVCPSTAGNRDKNTCKYLSPAINLFQTSISQEAVTRYVDKYSPIFINKGKGSREDFVTRVDYILESAKTAGLNPVLFLGYWRSESGFGTVGDKDMGCINVESNFYSQVDCAMGIKAYSNPTSNPIANCARSKDENSEACKSIRGIRKNSGYDTQNPIKYPIATFDDFAEAHGPFAHDPEGTRGNCVSTYNVLLEVASELNACSGSPAISRAPGQTGPASCPIPNGTLTCGSLRTPAGGCSHCSAAYRAAYPKVNCDAFPQTGFAIDIGGSDFQEVILPTINGHEVEWTYVHPEPKSRLEAIKGFAGKDLETNDKFYLQLHHVDPGGDPKNTVYKSGDVGARICGNGCGQKHVHVEVGTGGSSLGAVTWADAAQFFCTPAV